MKRLYIFTALLLALTTAHAQDDVSPAKPYLGKLYIIGGTIHVGNGQVIEKGTIEVNNGKIVDKSGRTLPPTPVQRSSMQTANRSTPA